MPETFFVPPTRVPKLLIRNISDYNVLIMDWMVLGPGETKDAFAEIEPGNTHDLVARAIKELTPPTGDLYIHWKVTKRIEILDFRLWSHSVDASLVRASNDYFEGAVLGYEGGNLKWMNGGGFGVVNEPLQVVDSTLSIPKASAIQDGYISKEDYQYIFSSIRRKVRIWQYQDFAAPLTSTAITLSAFQNGTGLSFDESYVVNDSAHIVKIADLDSPPTSTDSAPARWLPSSRVKVTSHIGDQVIVNQLPANTQGVRVYYQISLPDGVNPPVDYQQAPKFLGGGPSDLMDEYYQNQNQDEQVFGDKTFTNSVTFNTPITYTSGVMDGYVLTSDSMGVLTLQPPSATVVVGQVAPPANPAEDGYIWVNLADGQIFSYDAGRNKWLGDTSDCVAYGGRNAFSNQYLHFSFFAASSMAPYRAKGNQTIIGISLASNANIDVQYILYVNGAPQYIVFISATSNFVDMTLNIDVVGGDEISLFCNGTSLEFPEARVYMRNRQ